ncbi:FMN-dependent NADH-azoreductase [Roseibium aggregatum]|uniref:FMN dependent NADH:quinone oxidoreductase n=1 Tax=Roseibium aggregatum TaxID=187304 RepID=A0A939EJU6_9HYPH|nr:NAD(P)H-dependent oxidoreductase [Roseibium aggregatum]MBN9673643.1 NAD(P)H-dependent oxidoreductase [Roseibium aggregatum]
MTTLLHIDSSARSGGSDEHRFGSHSRRLSRRFVSGWKARRPGDAVVYRDVGAKPPEAVSGSWIHAAFTPPENREHWMREVLAESDELVDELLQADVIVAGVPMYNFGVPAQFKAYIDNIVRVGRTFGFDRSRPGEPYWPMVPADKTLVILSSRGDYGYEAGGRLANRNHVEPGIKTAFSYLGITDVHSVAVEFDEFADERLQASIASAEGVVDKLVADLSGRAGKERAA